MGVEIKKGTDLECFVELVRGASGDVSPEATDAPDVVLYRAPPSNEVQFREEITRLWRSLKIACAAGTVPEKTIRILSEISENLTKTEKCYVPLSDRAAWTSAVRWAVSRVDSSDPEAVRLTEHDRELHVGRACRRLADRGYRIAVDTNGPLLEASDQTVILEYIGTQAERVGGASVLQWICSLTKDRHAHHDGLWLLGNRVGNFKNALPPALPIGWLFSIAVRHIHKRTSSTMSNSEWNEILELVTDFATIMDCQRYNQFDGMNLHAVNFVPVLEQSLKWRELFSLPQMPPFIVATLREAFGQVEWPAESDDLRYSVKKLLAELERLLFQSNDADLKTLVKDTARRHFPLLWCHSMAEAGRANAGYLGPFEPNKRNHDRFVFFETEDCDILVLPRAMTTAAGLTTIFELIWSRKLKGTDKFVGNVFEKAIYLACGAKFSSVYEGVHYNVGKKDYEIDVAAKSGRHVILIETKAKMLTSESRTVDMMAFLKDYTNSYLKLLKQLVRHDRNLTKGITPLTGSGEDTSNLHVTKIAVSPLSFGPSSDKTLANALLCSVANARFETKTGDPIDAAVVDGLNAAIEEIGGLIKEDDQDDLFGYMMGVIWLDIGQLLYVLKRCRSLDQLLSPIGNITTGSQDFWTEVANADRWGLSKNKWYPPGSGDTRQS